MHTGIFFFGGSEFFGGGQIERTDGNFLIERFEQGFGFVKLFGALGGFGAIGWRANNLFFSATLRAAPFVAVVGISPFKRRG